MVELPSWRFISVVHKNKKKKKIKKKCRGNDRPRNCKYHQALLFKAIALIEVRVQGHVVNKADSEDEVFYY